MQISRHWRMNSQRYRLQGVRYQNGEVSLQARQTLPAHEAARPEEEEARVQTAPVYAVVGR